MSVRRLVTGVDAEGRSTVTVDGDTPGHLDLHSAAIASFAPRDTPPYS